MYSMRILITGATGFVGQNLMTMLVDKCPEAEILVLCRNVDKAHALFPNLSVWFKEAEDWDSVKAFNPQIVLHLASLSTSRNDTDIIQPLVQSNILYGIQLLDALKECKSLKLFVNTGSFAEYRFGKEATLSIQVHQRHSLYYIRRKTDSQTTNGLYFGIYG